MNENLYNLFLQNSQSKLQKICVLFENANYTYSDFLSYVFDIKKLIDLDFNDVVASVIRNIPEAIASFFAICEKGIHAPINPEYLKAEVEFILQDLNVKVLLIEETTKSLFREIAQELNIKVVVIPSLANYKTITQMPSFSERNPKDGALSLYTSGTTAKPKQVLLTHKNIQTSICYLQSTFQLTESDRYFNIMPLYHLHGFLLCVASIISGIDIIFMKNFDAREFRLLLYELCPTFYSSSPSFHQAILEELRDKPLVHKLRFIRSSAASLPLEVEKEMRKVFQIPILQGYGMTETTMCATNMTFDIQKHGSVGTTMGAEVAIIDEQGNFLPSGQQGEVVFRGDNIIEKYGGDFEQHQDSFFNGWLRSGDLGYTDNDNCLFITGRCKEMINRGGQKISPYEVENVLLKHENVKEVAVFSVPHKTLGENVASVIAVYKETPSFTEELRKFALQHISSYKVPAEFTIVDKIPKGSTGKIQRSFLGEQISKLKKDTKRREDSSAKTDAQKILLEAFRKVLKVDNIDIDDNFFDLGGHSLLIPKLFAEIEQKINKKIPHGAIFENPSIRQLVHAFEKEKFSCVRTFRKTGNKPPIFFIHSVEGQCFNYNPIAEFIAPEHPIYFIDAPVEDNKFIHFSSIEETAKFYVEAIYDKLQNQNFILGGHSFGGRIAFEMARILTKKNKKPLFIFMFDSDCFYSTTKYFNIWAILHFFKYLPTWMYSLLKDKSKWQRMLKILRINKNYQPETFIDALDENSQNYVNQNLNIIYSYSRSRRPYEGKIIFFKAKQSEVAHPLKYRHVDYNWEKFTGTKPLIIIAEGDHKSIVAQKNAETLAIKLNEHLMSCSKNLENLSIAAIKK